MKFVADRPESLSVSPFGRYVLPSNCGEGSLDRMDTELVNILPHRPPMVMIDSLVRCDTQSAVALKTFDRDDYGVSGDHVLEPALIECLAQTVAAMYGSLARASGLSPRMGMLVGVSDFRLYEPARLGLVLELVTEVTKRLGPFCMVTGTITQGETLVARGNLKFYVEDFADEAEEKPKTEG